jgi:hypothetical protein
MSHKAFSAPLSCMLQFEVKTDKQRKYAAGAGTNRLFVQSFEFESICASATARDANCVRAATGNALPPSPAVAIRRRATTVRR